MAEEVQISGTNEIGKIRNPLGVVGLSIITLGIYAIFWYYFTQKELAEMGRARNTEELGTSPGNSVLAITLGAFIIVPPFVSIYHAAQRQRAAQRLVGAQEGMEPGLLLLIWIFISPIALYIYQSDQNGVLEAQAGAAPAAAPQVPPPAEQPAQPQAAPPPPAQPPQGS
jgi:drug/metabolite transporter (DMT)-like permease